MAPWLNRLPVFRTYEALRVAQERLATTKQQLRKMRDERDLARRASAHVISYGRLKDMLGPNVERYRSAQPFPFIVLDDVFEEPLLDEVLREYEAMDRSRWHCTDRETERKFSTDDFLHFGPLTRALIAQLNAAPFLVFLERLTGIDGLIPDPHLRGGGLHEIKREGKLDVHADFNFYRRLKLYRRLNVLLYLNRDWSEDWHGELELWDRSGSRCVERIAPRFNRLVIFDTSNSSYHGHPAPLACPPDRARRSIALYYYTVDAPAENDRVPHSTIFLGAERTSEPEALQTASSHVPST